MEFNNQAELLRNYWKNPDDRNLVKRWIRDGKVKKEGDLYIVIDEEELTKKKKKSEWVEKEVEEEKEEKEIVIDNKELDELKKKNEQLMEAYKSVVSKYNKVVDAYKKEKEKADEQWWLYNHLVYFYLKFKDWKKFVDWKVFWQAEHNKSERWTQDTMETVRPEVYERYKFTYWEVEEAECEAVEKIIAKRAEELAEIPF